MPSRGVSRLAFMTKSVPCLRVPVWLGKALVSGMIGAKGLPSPEAIMSSKPITDNTLFYGDNLSIWLKMFY